MISQRLQQEIWAACQRAQETRQQQELERQAKIDALSAEILDRLERFFLEFLGDRQILDDLSPVFSVNLQSLNTKQMTELLDDKNLDRFQSALVYGGMEFELGEKTCQLKVDEEGYVFLDIEGIDKFLSVKNRDDFLVTLSDWIPLSSEP